MCNPLLILKTVAHMDVQILDLPGPSLSWQWQLISSQDGQQQLSHIFHWTSLHMDLWQVLPSQTTIEETEDVGFPLTVKNWLLITPNVCF